MPGNRFYHSPLWRQLRLKTLKRDHFRCVKCGVSVAKKGESRVDHILPRKTYPELAYSLKNLQTLCRFCDNRKHWEKLGARPKVIPTGADGYPEES